jgi:hypothetical protein
LYGIGRGFSGYMKIKGGDFQDIWEGIFRIYEN